MEITLLGEGETLTVRAGRVLSILPASWTPATPSAGDGKSLELGVRVRVDIDGEIRAVRFYKTVKDIGPHVVSVWDGTGFLLAQTTSSTETASGWQQVALPQPVRVSAGRNYTVSYHNSAGYFCTTVGAFAAGPIVNGPLRGLAGVFAYGAVIGAPESTGQGQNYGVDLVFSTGVHITTPAVVAPLRMAKSIAVGASGLVKFGFNQHAWGWKKFAYDGLNARAMRINASFNRYLQLGAYPGPAFNNTNTNYNAITQDTIQGACNDGFDVVLALTNPTYTAAGDVRFPAFCAAAATANLANVNKVILEIGNEPNFNGVVSGAAYAAVLMASAAAIRAVSPKFRIAGPTVNASYVGNAQKFVNEMMAVPGVEKCFDLGSFHPYYHTPELCYQHDLAGFINRVDVAAVKAGRTDLEYLADEAGYCNATGALTAWGLDPNAENVGALGGTNIQGFEWAANYYSRLIPIMRSTAKLRMVTFYALKDEGAPNDPAFTSGQAHFGVWDEYQSVLKPAGLVCKDLLAHMHLATGSEMFQREGRYDGCWYARLDLPQTKELLAWSLTGPRDEIVAVNAPQGCMLSISIAGAPANATKLQLTPGTSMVPVKLGPRSIVISADRPVTFPEFVGAT